MGCSLGDILIRAHLVVLALTLATLAAPAAVATHGSVGSIFALMADNSLMRIDVGHFVSGTTHTWATSWHDPSGALMYCFGKGTIETGIVPSSPCPRSWSIGATGDPHAETYDQVDAHLITLRYDNIPGQGIAGLCPARGNFALPCSLVVGARVIGFV